MRRVFVIAAVSAAALTAGCSASGGHAPTAPTSPTTTASPAPDDTAPPAPLHFGKTKRYPDGLAVTVSRVKRFTPSKELLAAYGASTQISGLRYEVQVTNHSDASYDGNFLDSSLVFTLAGDHADALCDVAKKVTCGGASRVLPGRTLTTSYGVMATRSQIGMVDIQVSLDANHDPAVWEGTIQ